MAADRQRLVGEVHIVVELVAALEPFQNAIGFIDTGLFDEDGLESPLEGFVFLDVLLVVLECRGADAPELTAGEGALQHVGGIETAFHVTGAHHRVQLVDEEDDLTCRRNHLVLDRFESFFELASKLRAGDDFAHFEHQDALVEKRFRNFGLDDALGEPFYDDGFAHARFADEHRIVFLSARQDLNDPANSSSRDPRPDRAHPFVPNR